MAAHRRNTSPEARVLLVTALTVFVIGSAVAGIVRQTAELGPKLGDIITFDPADEGPDTDGTVLTATRPDGTDCTLDVTTIRRSGGSFILEQRDAGPDLPWRAHWAGARTGDGPADCGAQADVIISSMNVTFLAAAAGGFGVSHTPVLSFR